MNRWLLLMLCVFLPARAGDLPIRSPAELHRHLQEQGTRSPLWAMPLGARERFLASLQFGANGIGGFATADLTDSLTNPQIHAVLSLFGLEAHAPMLAGLTAERAPRPGRSLFERRFEAFTALPGPPSAKAYRTLLAGQEVSELAVSLDAYDRALLFRAVLARLRADDADQVAGHASGLLATLHQAQEAGGAHYRQLFDLMVMRRDFSAADAMRHRYPEVGLPSLPALEPGPQDGSGNAAIKVSADGARMRRIDVDIRQGVHIVVVAGCHFSRDAARAIQQEPALDAWFRQHATWLAPSDEPLTAAADWNREFPERPLLIAWREADWPQISAWAMPTFLIFRDGVLLRSFSGWPADTGLATLRRELAAAGIGLPTTRGAD